VNSDSLPNALDKGKTKVPSGLIYIYEFSVK